MLPVHIGFRNASPGRDGPLTCYSADVSLSLPLPQLLLAAYEVDGLTEGEGQANNLNMGYDRCGGI